MQISVVQKWSIYHALWWRFLITFKIIPVHNPSLACEAEVWSVYCEFKCRSLFCLSLLFAMQYFMIFYYSVMASSCIMWFIYDNNKNTNICNKTKQVKAKLFLWVVLPLCLSSCKWGCTSWYYIENMAFRYFDKQPIEAGVTEVHIMSSPKCNWVKQAKSGLLSNTMKACVLNLSPMWNSTYCITIKVTKKICFIKSIVDRLVDCHVMLLESIHGFIFTNMD